jgi:two-component system, LytTR family, response regulator
MHVLIVDDEAPSRRKIRYYLRDRKDIEVAGECRTGAEALQAIRESQPDLVLLDVQMPGLNGLEVVRQLEDEDIPLPSIIFITAHDDFAVEAFEVSAVDYLLKPFTQSRFDRAIERARATHAASDVESVSSTMRQLLQVIEGNRSRGINRILVKDGEKTVVLPTRDVHWVSAANNYLEIHTAKATFLLRRKIGELEAELPPSQFVRIHRSTLVSIRQIKALRPLFNKDHAVTLHDGTELIASRTYFEQLMAALLQR